MGILHHIGLVNEHKNLFEGMSIMTAVEELKKADPVQFAEIIEILSSKL